MRYISETDGGVSRPCAPAPTVLLCDVDPMMTSGGTTKIPTRKMVVRVSRAEPSTYVEMGKAPLLSSRDGATSGEAVGTVRGPACSLWEVGGPQVFSAVRDPEVEALGLSL